MNISLLITRSISFTVVASALMLGEGAIAAPHSAANSGFDLAVQKIGVVKKGKISYVQFSDRPNPVLHKVLQEQFQELINNSGAAGRKSYSYSEVDIDGDGRKDAFVSLLGSLGSGSGGNHTWVFRATDEGYELVDIFYHQISLVIMPKSQGWRNVFVVPGKLFSPGSGVSYMRCSYSSGLKWRGEGNFQSPSLYRDCSKVQRAIVVSGEAIETSTFRRNPPEFDLTSSL